MGHRLSADSRAGVLLATGCAEADPSVDVERDLAAIERLHARDVRAVKTGDYETLRSLWSDDAVVMPPGAPWIRGSDALDGRFKRRAEAIPEFEVVEYDIDFEDVQIFGDYAFEWGTIRGASRPIGDSSAPVQRPVFKVLRILQKQPDGECCVHRAMWNTSSDANQERAGR